MKRESVAWQCMACKDWRPDDRISVAKRKIDVDRGEPAELNARYCNDRMRCLQHMPAILDAMARPVLDNLVAPLVHVLWNGGAICDPHKRFPEDFPEGTRWVGADDQDAETPDVVSCEPCRGKVASLRERMPGYFGPSQTGGSEAP